MSSKSSSMTRDNKSKINRNSTEEKPNALRIMFRNKREGEKDRTNFLWMADVGPRRSFVRVHYWPARVPYKQWVPTTIPAADQLAGLGSRGGVQPPLLRAGVFNRFIHFRKKKWTIFGSFSVFFVLVTLWMRVVISLQLKVIELNYLRQYG